MEQIERTIAIIGYPQQGKSVLKQHLEAVQSDRFYRFIELPGVHMLGRNTQQEERAYDFLLGRHAEAPPPYGILAVADSASLERQLYLIFQLIDLRLPFLLCLAGEERARLQGLHVNVERLGSALGVQVVSLDRGTGEVEQVLSEWREANVQKIKRQPVHWRPSKALADAYQHLDAGWIYHHLRLYPGARLVEGLRLLTVPRAVDEYEGHPAYESLLHHLEEARSMLEERNEKWTRVEVIQRTRWIGQVMQTSTKKEEAESSAPEPRRWWQKFF